MTFQLLFWSLISLVLLSLIHLFILALFSLTISLVFSLNSNINNSVNVNTHKLVRENDYPVTRRCYLPCFLIAISAAAPTICVSCRASIREPSVNVENITMRQETSSGYKLVYVPRISIYTRNKKRHAICWERKSLIQTAIAMCVYFVLDRRETLKVMYVCFSICTIK